MWQLLLSVCHSIHEMHVKTESASVGAAVAKQRVVAVAGRVSSNLPSGKSLLAVKQARELLRSLL